LKEIITLLIIAGALMLSFPLMLILGIARKSLRLVIASVAAFFLSSAVGVWAGVLFVSKTYRTVTTMFRPRTGDEIYTALFGLGSNGCVRVIDYQDQILPKIDYAIWLHFKTCPAELSRILARQDFKAELLPGKGLHVDGPSANANWFDPSVLGDSVLVCSHTRDDHRGGQTIYAARDSSEVYAVDVFD
jgi:hypothetical protein